MQCDPRLYLSQAPHHPWDPTQQSRRRWNCAPQGPAPQAHVRLFVCFLWEGGRGYVVVVVGVVVEVLIATMRIRIWTNRTHTVQLVRSPRASTLSCKSRLALGLRLPQRQRVTRSEPRYGKSIDHAGALLSAGMTRRIPGARTEYRERERARRGAQNETT